MGVGLCVPQVEDALYFLPNPFPEDQLVGVTKQTLAIVDDSNREVPLSEVWSCSLAPYAFSHRGPGNHMCI